MGGSAVANSSAYTSALLCNYFTSTCALHSCQQLCVYIVANSSTYTSALNSCQLLYINTCGIMCALCVYIVANSSAYSSALLCNYFTSTCALHNVRTLRIYRCQQLCIHFGSKQLPITLQRQVLCIYIVANSSIHLFSAQLPITLHSCQELFSVQLPITLQHIHMLYCSAYSPICSAW